MWLHRKTSHLYEHFQFHPEAHDFKCYCGNLTHIRICDVTGEAEPVWLLIGVTIETEHCSASLEPDRDAKSPSHLLARKTQDCTAEKTFVISYFLAFSWTASHSIRIWQSIKLIKGCCTTENPHTQYKGRVSWFARCIWLAVSFLGYRFLLGFSMKLAGINSLFSFLK